MRIRFRVWQMFIPITLVAVCLWLSQHVGIELVRHPRLGGYVSLYWDRQKVFDYDFLRRESVGQPTSVAGGS